MRPRLLAASVVALALLGGSASAHSPYYLACTTVARSGMADPAGHPFTNHFGREVALNAFSTVFVAVPAGGAEALYRYGPGGPEIIAARGDAAPGGGSLGRIDALSITNDGSVAFRALLKDGGASVLLRVTGAALTSPVRTGDVSPAGGTFVAFPVVTGVRSVLRTALAFVGSVSGGPDGVFVAEPSGVVAAALEGGTDGAGNTFCEFPQVGGPPLIDFPDVTRVWPLVVSFVATTGAGGCAGGATGSALYLTDGTSPILVARTGDPAPVAGAVFAGFVGDVASAFVDGIPRVLFQARLRGARRGTGLFLWTGSSGAVETVALSGDPVPGTTGLLGRLDDVFLGDSEISEPVSMFRAAVRRAPERAGAFLYFPCCGNGPLVLDSSAVPTDAFGAGARFGRFRAFGAAAETGVVALLATVRDGIAPASKTALLRCTEVFDP